MNKQIIRPNGVDCKSKYPCHQYFTCPRCARIRKSKIARTIETPSREQPHRTWQVYKIEDDCHIPTMTARLTRALRPLVAGGMWSIEYGAKGMGLHINVLTAGEQQTAPLDIAGITHKWQSSIAHDEMGFVGAYACKFEQMPPREIYAGRTVALFGDWRGRDVKPLRDLTVRAGADCMQIGDVFKTMSHSTAGKHLGRALINANALISVIRQIAPEVMTGFEREASRYHMSVALNALNRLDRAHSADLSN